MEYYGTGAILAVPPDQRDLDFARKYDLDVPVVVPENTEDFAIGDEAYTGSGRLANSDFLDGLDVEAAKIRGCQPHRSRRSWHRKKQISVSETGVFPDNATGVARSRLSIVKTAEWFR